MQKVIHIHNSFYNTNPFWPCLLLNLSPISGRRVCLCRILIRKALRGSEKMINEESLLVVFTVIWHLSVVCQKATFNYYFFSYVSAFLACNYSYFYSFFFFFLFWFLYFAKHYYVSFLNLFLNNFYLYLFCNFLLRTLLYVMSASSIRIF